MAHDNASCLRAQDEKSSKSPRYINAHIVERPGGDMVFSRPIFEHQAPRPEGYTPLELVLLENTAVALKIVAAHPDLLRPLVQAFNQHALAPVLWKPPGSAMKKRRGSSDGETP
jgi:hypothetical protein